MVLETTKSFATFRYELSVEERADGNSLYYKILGLKAPQLSLPSSGHAEFVREYEGLAGVYHVSVEALDGTVATCSVRITPTKVQLIKGPPHRLVEFVTDRKLWYIKN